MRELDRHAAGTVGVSFSEDLAYCLYARDVWRIRTPVASRVPRCTPAVADTHSRSVSPPVETRDLETGWERWWQTKLEACVSGISHPAARPGSQPLDEFAGAGVQHAFRALYQEAREWVTRCKAEHIRLIQLTRAPQMRISVLDQRPGKFSIVCIPVESSFGQLISPNHALVSPDLFGNQPDFLDWLSTALAAL